MLFRQISVNDYCDFNNDGVEAFGDFAVFAARGLGANHRHNLALFAVDWLADGSRTADQLYDASPIVPLSSAVPSPAP
jgi:hypothetical protein